jgi:hypothetical protein
MFYFFEDELFLVLCFIFFEDELKVILSLFFLMHLPVFGFLLDVVDNFSFFYQLLDF